VVRGKWADPEFSPEVSELNPKLKDTQFGRLSRARRNSARSSSATARGNLLGRQQQHHPAGDPEKFKKAVHLDSIHVDFGMQCVDCHFDHDTHGTGAHLWRGAGGNRDHCRPTATAPPRHCPDLRTHGPAAPASGPIISLCANSDGRAR